MSTLFKERQAIAAARTGADEPEQARQLSPTEREWKQRIYERLLKVLDFSLLGSMEVADARDQIREITNRLLLEESAPLSLAQRQFVTRRIEDEVMGLGPLEPLLADPTISDILVNAHDQVYVERHGKLELTEVRFNDDAHLMNIIDRIVSAVGRRVDESSPMVDARLKDGSRVNVIIPPLALDGPILSIRRFAIELLKAEDLIRLGTIDESLSRVLRGIVQGRLNTVISGGTGAGKTTTRSGSSLSRTRRSCNCSSRTSCGSKHVRQTSRAKAG
jgi:pilus assembly protein CpaF